MAHVFATQGFSDSLVLSVSRHSEVSASLVNVFGIFVVTDQCASLLDLLSWDVLKTLFKALITFLGSFFYFLDFYLKRWMGIL